MDAGELENLFWAYRDRILDLKKDGRMRSVLIYKNFGEAAGATLDHSYSLLLALPVVPGEIVDELQGAGKHYAYKERCIYCDIVGQELKLELRVVSETRSFIAIEPFAPRVPFETWIIPKRHSSRYEEIDSQEVGDLAALFKDVLSRLQRALNAPPYNYALHTAPFDRAYDREYHWHLEIIPRIGIQSGLPGARGYMRTPPPRRMQPGSSGLSRDKQRERSNQAQACPGSLLRSIQTARPSSRAVTCTTSTGRSAAG